MKAKNGLVWMAVAGLLAGVAVAGESKSSETTPATKAEGVKPQTTCPVMGGAVDKSKFVDVDGKRIYVCCAGCMAAVKKDPAKYIKQLEAAGVTLEKAPKAK